MKDQYSYAFSLSWRILWCLYPLVTQLAHASDFFKILSNDNIRNVTTNYSDSIVIVMCVFFLFAGTFIGYFYPTPQYGLKPYPKFVKLFISFCGGVLAFIYYLDDNKQITPAVCIYVAGVSFVAPAIIHLIHAGAIKLTGEMANVSDDDIDRINKTFKDED